MIRSASVRGAGTFLLALAMPLTVAAQGSAPREAVYAIRNATVVPVVGPRILNGTVVIRGSRIEAVGANVTIPPGATVIDAQGLFVYPGMIDSGTQLGLSEIGSVPGSTDTQELGTFNPHDDALTAVNPHSEHFPTTRVNGITTAITSAGGGLVSGAAALINLAGWTPDEMAVVHRAGMVVSYPRGGGGGRGGRFRQQPDDDAAAAQSRQVTQLHDYFREAKAYSDTRAKLAADGQEPARLDLPMEAMLPVIRGELPVIVDAGTEAQIRGALALADSFGVKVILRGANEGWKLAEQLATRKIPVIVGPTTESPGNDDPYDMIYANAGVLAKAGVLIAFQTNSVGDARNLPFNAALAQAHGLDAEESLRAVTINPATIWGVADRLGSIETGKVANLIVTNGDPLDVRTTLRHLFINGERIELTDRHTKLYEQFKGRPKP